MMSTTPYLLNLMSYLVLGDGDFSFSLSLSRKNTAKGEEDDFQLVATSLETFEQILCRPNSVENITELKRLKAIILHGVDGTSLNSCIELVQLGKKFDGIIFNFPHTGGKSHIKNNRTLLRNFFISAATFLEKEGHIHVSLCKGQGGTPIDCSKRGYENSWKVVEMATEAGLVLSAIEPFRAEDYPGYVPTGYRGQAKGFILEGALRHSFTFPENATLSLYPPCYVHDVSFWWDKERGEHEERVREIVKGVAGDNAQSVECVSTYQHPKDLKKVSYLYRLVYCSHTYALSRTRAGELQLQLRTALCTDLGVEIR